MKVVTEIELREQYKHNAFETYIIKDGERLTPAASQFINERHIKIIKEGSENRTRNPQAINNDRTITKRKEKIDYKNIEMPKEGYICLPSGKHVSEKPEYYTHLKGRILVPKRHPRIQFRGKLDLLESYFINCINQVSVSGQREMAEDLTYIFEYMQKIMRAEVLDEELPFIDFKGWTDAEIREYSHYPDKYFGVKHFTPSPKYGLLFGSINQVRAMIRQLEIEGVTAFYDEDEDKCEREDILLALNRLSSLIYIIMCQYLGGQYKL